MALSVLSRNISSIGSMRSPNGRKESYTSFIFLSEDIIVNIFSRLEEDPRHLARLACVCERFLHVVRNVCWKRHCVRLAPELFPSPRVHLDSVAPPPGGWGGLMKLLVCCPGLKHAGVTLECWDFGLERELRSSAQYSHPRKYRRKSKRRASFADRTGESKDGHADTVLSVVSDLQNTVSFCKEDGELSEVKVESSITPVDVENCQGIDGESRLSNQFFGEIIQSGSFKEVESANLLANSKHSQSTWTSNEVRAPGEHDIVQAGSKKRKEASSDTTEKNAAMRELSPCLAVNFYSCDKSCSYTSKVKMQESIKNSRQAGLLVTLSDQLRVRQDSSCADSCNEIGSREAEQCVATREGACDFKPLESHVASGAWKLSREQGNKLLASRFRADCLYICDWPGCEHPGGKRKYMLFRGIFKNFKASHVWRNLKDMKSKPIGVPCAFCDAACSWDMMTGFCLRRSFEYHDDGEPVVRAYVCENGHVSGAWTDRPLYTL